MSTAAPVSLADLFAQGNLDAVVARASQLISQHPLHAEAHHVLGLTCYERRHYDKAIHYIRRSLELGPTAHAWSNLGAALRALGRLSEAEAAYRTAIALTSAYPTALANLANVLMDRFSFAEAEALARRAVAAGADTSEAYTTLGNALFRLGRLVEATHAYRQALALGRDHGACESLAIALAYLGRFADAEDAHRMAIELCPNAASAHSKLLITLNYHPDLSAEAIFAEYRRFDQLYAAPLTRASAPHANLAHPERALRVGYVSPNFNDHVVAGFVLPLLERHDKSLFEITCYAEVRAEDGTSRRTQQLGNWVTTVGLTDDALASRIREDRIDILVDLAGHSVGNRLMTFARRPAPVQLSYMIGHGTTTGLSAIDGFIADAAMIPLGSEHLLSETPARLDRVPIAYIPPSLMPPVLDLPAYAKGYVTFAYFGRPIRLNDHVIRAWAEILKRTPGSRLLLNYATFGDRAFCDVFKQRFGMHGIGPEQLDYQSTSPQPNTWAAYNQVDIALDPFPHNAGTTTIEALWMGVPVVSLADRPTVGRFGAAILGSVGLSDWVANSTKDYVARAVTAAADLEWLASLRRTLRPQVAASPLCDAEDLTRGIEALYREFWRQWCGRKNLKRDVCCERTAKQSACLESAIAAMQMR